MGLSGVTQRVAVGSVRFLPTDEKTGNLVGVVNRVVAMMNSEVTITRSIASLLCLSSKKALHDSLEFFTAPCGRGC